jgi:hypothetical protein
VVIVVEDLRLHLSREGILLDDVSLIEAVRFKGIYSIAEVREIMLDTAALKTRQLEKIIVGMTDIIPKGTHSYFIKLSNKKQYVWPAWYSMNRF